MNTNVPKSEDAAKKILKNLNFRAREVLERRFGLNPKSIRETLEAIGDGYGITRERVRQIESHALSKLRTLAHGEDYKDVFASFKEEIRKRGGVAREDLMLDEISGTPAERNSSHLFLTLAGDLFRFKENEHFYNRLTLNKEVAGHAEEALKRLHGLLDYKSDPISENEIVAKLASIVKDLAYPYLASDISGWLFISKRIARNQFGEWGLSDAPTIRPRGVRDLAYLVMRRHGSPMHFREVAASIKQMLGRKAHDQTVHNELIKDNRFVLVGRGLYALNEWGYQPGIVRDVIKAVIVKHGPLSKDELVKKVLQERHVKENTILINLQNKDHFQKAVDGSFGVV